MHHFIYPSKDTYISSRPGFTDKNFGLDEILQIGTSNVIKRFIVTSRNYPYVSTIFYNYPVQYFTGIFTGSIKGTVVDTYGTLVGDAVMFTASYFSGSVDGGAIFEYNGAVSGSVDGLLTGSFSSSLWVDTFMGELSGSVGCLYGTASGTDVRNESYWATSAVKFIDRSLLHFDINAISASVANGSINSPKFHLKLKVCNEYELPITYTIYALPASQSWNMGNGYYSDAGSSDGVSWQYKDFDGGTQWYTPYTSSARPVIDFVHTPSNSTGSFEYGGGTWYTASAIASQSFNYESSDINMDVTDIVMSWISGSIPNEGLLLIHSDEIQSTGSGFILKFYSRDTNTIYSPYLDAMWLGNGRGGSSEDEFVTASVSTGSVIISQMSSGLNMTVQSGSTFYIGGGIRGVFSGSAYLVSSPFSTEYVNISGFTIGTGLSGNIKGMPVFGDYVGLMSGSQELIEGPCGNSFSASLATASFTSGVFSGSTFSAYYVDYTFENARLTGSWTEAALLGSSVRVPIPSAIYPYAYAYISGVYINGRALGTYTLSGSTSASFSGQIIDGVLHGGYLNVQLSGSVVTSSYFYTSSIAYTTSMLTSLDTAKPFTVNIQNVRPIYKVGDIVKIGVFGRKLFPLKTFGIATQQEQYLTPEYLPSSSYYALKDEETGEIVLDFDNYTQLGCEYPNGNYFVVDTTGLPQERYYRVLIRVEGNDTIYTIDGGKTFKIVR